jgi:hypothetical protein
MNRWKFFWIFLVIIAVVGGGYFALKRYTYPLKEMTVRYAPVDIRGKGKFSCAELAGGYLEESESVSSSILTAIYHDIPLDRLEIDLNDKFISIRMLDPLGKLEWVESYAAYVYLEDKSQLIVDDFNFQLRYDASFFLNMKTGLALWSSAGFFPGSGNPAVRFKYFACQ